MHIHILQARAVAKRHLIAVQRLWNMKRVEIIGISLGVRAQLGTLPNDQLDFFLRWRLWERWRWVADALEKATLTQNEFWALQNDIRGAMTWRQRTKKELACGEEREAEKERKFFRRLKLSRLEERLFRAVERELLWESEAVEIVYQTKLRTQTRDTYIRRLRGVERSLNDKLTVARYSRRLRAEETDDFDKHLGDWLLSMRKEPRHAYVPPTPPTVEECATIIKGQLGGGERSQRPFRMPLPRRLPRWDDQEGPATVKRPGDAPRVRRARPVVRFFA
jgi:hypothetical protein